MVVILDSEALDTMLLDTELVGLLGLFVSVLLDTASLGAEAAGFEGAKSGCEEAGLDA